MTAQTDGRAITNPENAQNFSHAEIKQAADQMNPDGLDGAFDAWSAIATAVTKAGQQFETAIQQAVEQHWEGAAADRAVRAIRDYATRVAELGESLDQQSAPLSSAASAAARFKVAVPSVVPTSNNPRGPELRNTQEEQARDDMSTLYIQPYGNTAPTIPTLPPPVDPISVPGVVPGVVPGISPTDTGSGRPGKTEDSGKTTEPGKTEDTSKAGNPSRSEDTGKTQEPAKTEESGTAEEPGKTADTGKTEAVAPQSVSPTQQSGWQTTPATTHTATTTTTPTTIGAQPTSPITVTSAGVTPGTASPSPSATSPNPSGASGSGATTPSPGKSVPGTTTPGAATTQPTTGTPSRVGAPGAAGYSGMFPPGARARRGEDGEHKAAAYLRTEEHGEELIGEVEKTVPPVLGAQ
ncbi:PPE domain-containing protein [Nocardia sp. CA-119907]|uniref:PPE domain-containing protein n=1 Tax=Nocardia sp. CA-119907 TaxID=3239973 RepID=UPI003D98BF69